MKKTILHDLHVSLGAKMAAFGGYEMPLRYGGGIIKEHGAARAGAAVFDTCHMGEFLIRGAGALAGLEAVLSCDVADLRVGACRYGFICNEAGGVIDDQIIYRMAEDEFMMVVNAATEEKDFEWVGARVSGASVENISRETAKIDLHGPGSPKVAAALLRDSIAGLKYYNFARNFYGGAEVVVSRTGYTGEIGFEVYCGVDAAKDFWNGCVERGAVPAGLGARDALRLEMGYPLYGNELSEERNAAQSDFTRAISRRKEFIGWASVLNPPTGSRLLRGIRLDGRRAARAGDVLLNAGGAAAGEVTSGSFSPSLGCAVALAYVDRDCSAVGTELRVDGGKGEVTGMVSELPFYKNATARADIMLYL